MVFFVDTNFVFPLYSQPPYHPTRLVDVAILIHVHVDAGSASVGVGIHRYMYILGQMN